MTLELRPEISPVSRPVYPVAKGGLDDAPLPAAAAAWAASCGFDGEAGAVLLVPGEGGSVAGALLGLGHETDSRLVAGVLAKALPAGDWHFAAAPPSPALTALALRLGDYVFTRYGKKPGKAIGFAWPDAVERAGADRRAEAVCLVRDLINTPSNDMGPDELEAAARALAGRFGADIAVTTGDELLSANFPMIHAVGRASPRAPRLIDLTWGDAAAPKVTLVGKGVCFDTGGLDIKTASGMLLMKKDMGGAANVLGLASLIMSAGLRLRLRVLIPAVENAISGAAFRPGDVLPSRKGLTVEIGNTDAEGRLVLADALALADEEQPQLIVDMATLTGAARVALGPDLPPFYTDDETLAADLAVAADVVEDPLWRMPLWRPYDRKLSSKIADLNNVTPDGLAGSVTAALFLRRFVTCAGWLHLDVFGWAPADRPHGPMGGEAQGIRALEKVLADRYG
jgi:leucyl aminopeptidase